MFLPELGKQIQGDRHLTSNNRIIRISAGSNNREFTVCIYDVIIMQILTDSWLNRAKLGVLLNRYYLREKNDRDLIS